jgi:ABC-type lipoprotein release transport system permease subunit
MILYASLMEGLFLSTERNALTMNLGELQIHARGYRDDPDLYTKLHGGEAIVSRLNRAGFNASPRLFGFALAAAGSSSAGVQLRGVNIEHEARVTQIHKHVEKGDWLSRDDQKGVVLGRKLARTLAVGIGDELVIVGQAADGSMANDLYKVRGVLKGVGEEIDRGGFFMLDSSFRAVMGLPEGVHEIVITRQDHKQSIEEAAKIIRGLYPQYEVLDWRKLSPLVAELIDLSDVNIYIMLVITYVAVAMVVLNAMLMSVFERIREFGVMKAIGFGPLQLFGLVYVETALQALLAIVIAFIFGLPLAMYFEAHGIDLTQFISGISFGGIAFDPIWRAELTQRAVAAPLVTMFIMAMLAVLYPAIKAAVIRPVKAIHYQ